MKKNKVIKLVLTVAALLAAAIPALAFADEGDVDINDINFPDAEFRTYVDSFDLNSDGKLDKDEILKVKEIACSEKNIKSLKGIEFFTNVESIACISNNLTSIDVSSNVNLRDLTCSENSITSLDLSHNTKLKSLCCDKNKLTSLELGNNKYLEYLSCENNMLTELDVTKNSNLESLMCSDNMLTKLDIGEQYYMQDLYCRNNKLTKLDLSQAFQLFELYCDNNLLTTLDVSNITFLWDLSCSNNRLTSLYLDKNKDLEHLSTSGNTYEITVASDRKFNLNALPGNFKISKTSSWSGGTVKGDTLTVKKGATKVTYKYKVGKNFSPKTFTLKVNKVSVPASKQLKTVYIKYKSYTYKGRDIEPTVTVKNANGKVVSNDNYTVTYYNNLKVGTAKIVVTGEGSYCGNLVKTFKINPPTTRITSLSKERKGFTVMWEEKNTQVSGYQVMYARNSKFKNYKTSTITKNTTTSKKITKLSSKKKYYVKVRTYKTVDGTRYYSKWSGYKTVVTR